MDGRQRPWTAGSSEPGRADPVPPWLPAAEDAFIRVRVRGFEGGAAVRQGSWVTSPPPAEWPEAAGTGNGHGGRQTSAPAPRAGQPAPRLLPARYPPGNAVCAILGKPMAFLPGPSRSPADGPGSAAAFPGGGGDPSSRCVRHFDRTVASTNISGSLSGEGLRGAPGDGSDSRMCVPRRPGGRGSPSTGTRRPLACVRQGSAVSPSQLEPQGLLPSPREGRGWGTGGARGAPARVDRVAGETLLRRPRTPCAEDGAKQSSESETCAPWPFGRRPPRIHGAGRWC